MAVAAVVVAVAEGVMVAVYHFVCFVVVSEARDSLHWPGTHA